MCASQTVPRGCFLSLLLCFLLLLAGVCSPVWGYETDLKARLLKVEAKLLALQRLWDEQKISLQRAEELSTRLQSELDEVNRLLEISRTSFESSQAELSQSTALSQSLQTRLDQLSETLRQERLQHRLEVIRGWSLGGLAGLVIGIILGVVLE